MHEADEIKACNLGQLLSFFAVSHVNSLSHAEIQSHTVDDGPFMKGPKSAREGRSDVEPVKRPASR